MDYCNTDDTLQRLQCSLRKHELYGRGTQILFIGLDEVTKRPHGITGWMAITGEDSQGVTHPLLDIFTGFDYENCEVINGHIKEACVRLQRNFKMM